MPEQETIERAREDAREGKSPSTQAGEFVREEMHHIREGKHGAKSTKQAIAIGLSKARRAGVKLPAGKGASEETRKKARQDIQRALQFGRRDGRPCPRAWRSPPNPKTARSWGCVTASSPWRVSSSTPSPFSPSTATRS